MKQSLKFLIYRNINMMNLSRGVMRVKFQAK